MAKLQLSKSSLAREQKNFRTFTRVLPSLDLKRQQVMAERAKAARALKQTRQTIDTLIQELGEKLPMLANREVDLTDLAKLTNVELETENVVGTKLPKLKRIEVEVRSYAMMGKPHWVDRVADALHEILEMRIRAQIDEERLTLLDQAVKTVTQRVNLFEKVLIPQAKQNIKRIRIYLSDMETAAVVRSKMSKNKRSETASG